MKEKFLDRLNELNNIPKEVLEDFILAERVWAGVNLFAILIGFLVFIIQLRKYNRKETNDPLFIVTGAILMISVIFAITTGQFYDYILLFFSEQVYLIENFDIKNYKW